MKIISCSLTNFASYNNLEFTFSDKGLCLIQGPTGSGKSTLCDAIPWILFGKTAKNGPVGDIVSWNSSQDTAGCLTLELAGSRIMVYRSRGKTNDLYYSLAEEPIRGKDLNDTQKLINSLLGIDSDLYLSGAYFHEFSNTAQFFSTTAKNRRLIFEQVIDLSLAVSLQDKISDYKKEFKTVLSDAKQRLGNAEYRLDYLISKSGVDIAKKYQNWNLDKIQRKKELESKYDTFEQNKRKSIANLLKNLDNDVAVSKCSLCGNETTAELIKSHYNTLLEKEESRENIYIQYIADLEVQENPYVDATDAHLEEVYAASDELSEAKTQYQDLNTSFGDVVTLEQVVDDFRSILIKNRVSQIENTTNSYLAQYFDSEIQIQLLIEDKDKLEVSILKDGNSCSFTQLSKGQRQLLKLSFGISIMNSISNHHGVHFNQLFFDEALDGLDTDFKIKAFGLLESLSVNHESVFVVEHTEALKPLFNNSYKVQLINGSSKIEEA